MQDTGYQHSGEIATTLKHFTGIIAGSTDVKLLNPKTLNTDIKRAQKKKRTLINAFNNMPFNNID